MNYEETLSTLKAIQASYAPVPFLANSETEPRFVIDSDTREIIIPEEFKFLAVKMDHMSEKIYFEIPRYFDDEDLATKICVVQYINTNGDVPIEAIVAAVDVDTESEYGKIIFRWDVDNYLTRYAGMVSFAVRFYTISDDNRFTYSWNTLPATLPVLDTLDNTNDTVSQNYPTELVQWQFRMSELDRTISGKIAEATVTIDADVKAAQAARKGAEEAESRINAIVAGNEAYTKQQSHDLFALALRGTAEASKSITVYPDKGSNVTATINGFVKQSGSGDPDPNNYRPIFGNGSRRNKLVITDSSGFALYWNGHRDQQLANGRATFSKSFSDHRHNNNAETAICSHFKAETSIAGGGGNREGFTIAANTYFYFCIPLSKIEANTIDSDDTLKTKFKQYLDNLIANGTPLTIWYIPSSNSDNDPEWYYAKLIGTGDDYSAVGLELSDPLYNGDSVITNQESGCDMHLVLDGSSDELWSYDSSAHRFVLQLETSEYPLPVSGLVQYSNYLPVESNSILSGKTVYGFYVYHSPYNGKTAIFVSDGLASSAEDLRNKLSRRPLHIRYHSTNYTKKNEERVSMDIRKNVRIVLDKEDDSYTWSLLTGGHMANGFVTLYVQSNSITSMIKNAKDTINVGTCSHFKSGTNIFSDVASTGFYVSPSSGPPYIGFRIQTAVLEPFGFDESQATGPELSKVMNAYLGDQISKGTPIEIVVASRGNIVYAHDPVDFIASPDEEGAWVITGEPDGTVSAEYNKNVTKAFEEILTRVSALELHALGG